MNCLFHTLISPFSFAYSQKLLFRILGDESICARLYWAGDWQSFREYPHSQLQPGGNPLKMLTPDQAYSILEKNGLLPEKA